MRLGFLRIVGLVALLALPATAFAQFGMPLQGEWSGGYGPNQANRVLMTLKWTGTELVGEINPGPNAAVLKTTTIDYSNPTAWKVKMTAEGKDASGKVVPITIDGTLENIGVYYKIFRGTWTQGTVKAPFVVTRN